MPPKGPDEGALPPKSLPPRGPTPLIKGRWPKARGDRERWLAEGQTDEGATIERFFVGPDALIGPLDGSFRRGDFAACGRRVSFWMPRKKPKRHQGAAQDERFALIFAAPGPHFTGAQLGSLAVIAKARVAQLTGCPSIAAAAEWSVTFGDCFDRWKARLLCGWGSSAAQGIGGRVRTPAPAEYPETRLSLRRGRSQTGPACLRAAQCAAPTAKNGPGALVRQTQAQMWNRTGLNFPHSQAPVGRQELKPATQILRAGNVLPTSRGNPRIWGPGKAVLWT